MLLKLKVLLLQVPSKLLIQVPRYGKQFKTYKKIVPALELDISELTESPRMPTFTCMITCVTCVVFFRFLRHMWPVCLE